MKKLIPAKITFLIDREFSEITLNSKNYDTLFKVELTPEQTIAVLSRLGEVDCMITSLATDLSNVDKDMEVKTLEFPLPESSKDLWSIDLENLAREESEKYIPEGWESDGYFRSQDSFFYKGKEKWARVNMRRYYNADKTEN